MTSAAGDHRSLKERAREELRLYWIITLYLALFLVALTMYRRLVLAEVGIAYLHYGFALVEALILAKIILIGEAIGVGRRFERSSLLVTAVVKSILFSLLAFLFTMVERVIEGLVHGKTWSAILASFVENGFDEMQARALMMFVAFVPFFAFWEMRRVLGAERFEAIVLSREKVEARPANTHPR